MSQMNRAKIFAPFAALGEWVKKKRDKFCRIM